ncbi:MAG: hypothetical protein MR605_00845 [Bacteroidales bacterium]|nr:hypothetical protein [Bacteroidales bacterium]
MKNEPAKGTADTVGDMATKSPGLFFSSRRVEKNSPGLVLHKSPTFSTKPLHADFYRTHDVKKVAKLSVPSSRNHDYRSFRRQNRPEAEMKFI